MANVRPDRLIRPLVHRGYRFDRASWDEAIDLIVRRMRYAKERYTAGSIGFYSSGQRSLKENYTLSMAGHLHDPPGFWQRRFQTVLRRSYFLTLGCRTNADGLEIHHAFRKLAQHYHPDRLGPKALDFFTDIVEAYRALRNPDQRLSYARGLQDDAQRSGGDVIMLQPIVEAPVTREVPAVCQHFIRTDATAASRTLRWEHIADRILHNFLAGASTRRGRVEGIDLQIQVKAGDALRGGIAVIEVPAFYPCSACHASGRRAGEACLECAERGVVEETEEVRVPVLPLLADYTRMEIPACGLGVHDLYLRLCFRIVGDLTRTSPYDLADAGS